MLRTMVVVQGDFSPEGPSAAIPPGSRIRELPRNLAASVTRRPWLVVDVRAESGGARIELTWPAEDHRPGHPIS